MSMSQFLLIHGAWHGARCWHKAIPELEKRGHRAKAIDLPGQGQDQTPLGQVTLDTMVDRTVAALGGLEFRNRVEVPPYHYGAVFERPR
jgi:pimeloyl-ACP methyl ester carboxylesterase